MTGGTWSLEYTLSAGLGLVANTVTDGTTDTLNATSGAGERLSLAADVPPFRSQSRAR